MMHHLCTIYQNLFSSLSVKAQQTKHINIYISTLSKDTTTSTETFLKIGLKHHTTICVVSITPLKPAKYTNVIISWLGYSYSSTVRVRLLRNPCLWAARIDVWHAVLYRRRVRRFTCENSFSKLQLTIYHHRWGPVGLMPDTEPWITE